jgi:hypothetical protein
MSGSATALRRHEACRPRAALRRYFAAVLSISAQACATAVFGSTLPGMVAQPPVLT